MAEPCRRGLRDPTVGHFKNAKLLTEAEIEILRAWAKNGAPEGDAKDKPAPVQFAEGWTIGKPDIVVEFPKAVQLPATGVIDQSNLVVKARFRARHVGQGRRSEAGQHQGRPSHESDHPPPGSTWLAHVPEGELYVPQRGEGIDRAVPRLRRADHFRCRTSSRNTTPAWRGRGSPVAARRSSLPPASDIVFEIHYTTTGKPETDRSMVGIVLADKPPAVRHLTVTGTSNGSIDIPPGDPNCQIEAEAVSPRTPSWCGCSRISTTAAGTSKCARCIRTVRGRWS